MALKKSHVTFDDFKRIISFQEDEDVSGLRHRFFRVFSDVLSDDVAPANVRFQQYDETFNEYVDLENGQKLEENARLKVVLKKRTLTAHVTYEGTERNVPFIKGVTVRVLRYLVMVAFSKVGLDKVPPDNVELLKYDESSGDYDIPLPLDLELDEDIQAKAVVSPPDLKPHTIKQDVDYQIWNIVSNGLIHQDESKVTCKGSFGDNPQNVLVQAKSVGKNEFNLVFNGDGSPNNYQYITSQGKGNQVIVQPNSNDESVFLPNYYWGHTMFRSKENSTLYLGTDNNKHLTMVSMEDPLYPNPQALFIVNTA